MKSSPQAQKGSGSGFAWYVRGHASGDGWAVIAFICIHHKYQAIIRNIHSYPTICKILYP